VGLDAIRIDGRSGVWIQDAQGDRKIAAIGIRVAQGVTMHGFALNVNPDLSAFRTIIPCGIADADVTSLEIELKKSITVDDVAPLVERHIFESLKKVSI
jgi:lipoyl(octanoyl) transferase